MIVIALTLEQTIDEAIYIIHGENLGNKMSTVNKADLLKPSCDVDLQKISRK